MKTPLTKILTISASFLFLLANSYSQSVSINTTGNAADTSAMLDVTSTGKGFLMPRMTAAQRVAIVLPADGLLVFQTDGTKGFWYYHTSTGWVLMAASNATITSLNGLTATTQTFSTPGTSGTAPNWSSSGSTHTFNLPMSGTSGVTAGLLSNTDWNTFNNKIGTVNGLTAATQSFATGTSGTDFNIGSSGSTHTFNIPDAGASARGAVTTGTQTFAGGKTFSSSPTFSSLSAGSVPFIGTGGLLSQNNASFYWDITNGRLGLGNNAPGSTLDVKGTIRLSGSTSGYVGFAPAAAAGSTVYTLPAADGISGQYLATNGSGVLSWASTTERSLTATITAGNMQPLARYFHTEGGVALMIQIQSATSGNSGTKHYLFQGGYNGLGTTNTWYKMQPVSNGRGHGDFPSGFDLYIRSTDYYTYEFAVSAVTNDKTLRTTFSDLSNGGITFTNISGNPAVAISSGGDVYSIRDMNVQNSLGIGTSAPGSALDVKGTLRLSGSTSGYVGLQPAAAAGSTTYVLPSADGSSGQQLTTNGSGTLSWSNQTGATSVSNTSSANNLSTTVNGVTGSNVSMVNSISNTSSANNLTTTVNGVAATAVPMVNSISNTSSTNSLATTVNGVAGSSVSIINSNATSLSGTNLTTTVNGVAATALDLTPAISAATTHTVGTAGTNIITSTVNGVADTSLAVNTVSNSISTNSLTTTVNGVASTPLDLSASFWSKTGNSGTVAVTNFIGTTDAVDFIEKTNNTERLRISSAGNVGINTTGPTNKLHVNGNARITVMASGLDTDSLVTVSSTGVINKRTVANVLSGGTTNTLGSSANTITSTVNGVAATAPAVNSVANTSSVNNLTTTINGVAGTAVPMVNSVANTSSVNNLTTTINGVAGTAVPMVNSNATSLSGSSLTTTVNGVAATALDLTPAITSKAWSLAGNTTSTGTGQFLGSTDNRSLRFRTNNVQGLILDSTGSVNIGNLPIPSVSNPEKLLVDAGSTAGNPSFTTNVISGKGYLNNFLQLNIQNMSTGNAASSDIVATNDAGTEANLINFIDMGINSSGYSTSNSNILNGQNNTYLYSSGADMIVGNSTAAKDLIIFTGGTAIANERMRIKGTGNMGIGTTTPGSTLDVKGTLRLSGTTSGYVGLQPAAAAGSTTYTLPAADGTTGQLLSTDGSGVLSWSSVGIGVAQMVRKTASETVTSSIVLQDDDHLFIPVVANGVYQVEVLLNITSSAGGAGGMKIGLSTPTGSTSNVLSEININDNFHWTRAWLTNNTSYCTENTIDNTKNPAARMNGIVTVGATAGVIKIQWAQNSSNSDPSILLPPSFLKVTRIQ